MPGSHTYVGGNTTEHKCSAVYGVSKRKELIDDI